MSFQGKGFKICDKIMFPEEEEKKERRTENPLFMPCRWKLGSSALSIDTLIMFWNKSWGIQSTLQMNCPPFKEETEIKDWQDEKKKQTNLQVITAQVTHRLSFSLPQLFSIKCGRRNIAKQKSRGLSTEHVRQQKLNEGSAVFQDCYAK